MATRNTWVGNIDKLINFFSLAGKLKKTMRFSEAEKIHGDSSADHSWRVALMAFTVARELNLKLNVEKAMKIALVHDIAEAITGDIDYRLIREGKVTKKQKNKQERKAFLRIKKMLSSGTGDEIQKLWVDYEEGASEEAKFVRALDKMETILHLIEAGHKTYDMPEAIAIYPNEAVREFPELKGMLKVIKKKLKKEFKKGGFAWKKEYDGF